MHPVEKPGEIKVEFHVSNTYCSGWTLRTRLCTGLHIQEPGKGIKSVEMYRTTVHPALGRFFLDERPVPNHTASDESFD